MGVIPDVDSSRFPTPLLLLTLFLLCISIFPQWSPFYGKTRRHTTVPPQLNYGLFLHSVSSKVYVHNPTTIMAHVMCPGELYLRFLHRGSWAPALTLQPAAHLSFPRLLQVKFLVLGTYHISLTASSPFHQFSSLFLIKHIFGLLLHPYKVFLFHFLIKFFYRFSHSPPPHKSVSPSSFFLDPFEVQVRAGCELHSSDIAESFLQAAYEGSHFLSFQNMSWVPAPEGDSRAQSVCDLMNQYEGIKETVHRLLTSTCPRFALGLFDAARVDYERQGSYSPFF